MSGEREINSVDRFHVSIQRCRTTSDFQFIRQFLQLTRMGVYCIGEPTIFAWISIILVRAQTTAIDMKRYLFSFVIYCVEIIADD